MRPAELVQLTPSISIDVGNLNHLEEKSQPPDCLDEFPRIDGFCYVAVTADFMAAGYLARIVSGGDYYDGHLAKRMVLLDLPEDLRAVDLRHADIQKEEVGGTILAVRSLSSLKEEIQDLLAVDEGYHLVCDPGTLEIPRDESQMSRVIFGNDDSCVSDHSALPPFCRAGEGRDTLNTHPSPGVDSTHILPFCLSRIRRTAVKPSPSPWTPLNSRRWKI